MSLSEAEVHWRAFLEALVSRGMHGIEMIVSDAHSGLAAARRAVFNAKGKCEAERLLRLTINKYEPIASELAKWLETSMPACIQDCFDMSALMPPEKKAAIQREFLVNNAIKRHLQSKQA